MHIPLHLPLTDFSKVTLNFSNCAFSSLQHRTLPTYPDWRQLLAPSSVQPSNQGIYCSVLPEWLQSFLVEYQKNPDLHHLHPFLSFLVHRGIFNVTYFTLYFNLKLWVCPGIQRFSKIVKDAKTLKCEWTTFYAYVSPQTLQVQQGSSHLASMD